jgi:hypothetical protein
MKAIDGSERVMWSPGQFFMKEMMSDEFMSSGSGSSTAWAGVT